MLPPLDGRGPSSERPLCKTSGRLSRGDLRRLDKRARNSQMDPWRRGRQRSASLVWFADRMDRRRGRHRVDRPFRAQRPLHALGLHHPVPAGDRRARLCRRRAGSGLAGLDRHAPRRAQRRRRARSRAPLSRAQGPVGDRRHDRQSRGARRGVPDARQVRRGARSLRQRARPAARRGAELHARPRAPNLASAMRRPRSPRSTN